jgi:gliding motility-associated-like protein
MRKWPLILGLALFGTSGSVAQQNNIWYFGRKAGLNFNQAGNQPIPATLTNSAMSADEGCASICNHQGEILFYTNGITVYNRDHEVMANGTGLMANISTLQGVIIVPVGSNDSIFYIFTADAVENNFANGYRYSIVDMHLDNGKGAVTTKNVLMHAPSTERMTAVRHLDGMSVWLITNDLNSNIFRSWLINCEGLQFNPVVSTVGEVLDQHFYIGVGMLKASPDAKQICQTHFPVYDETVIHPNYVQLFDFDNSTGILSNARSIGFPDSRVISCEFSPDSRLLYVSRPYENKIDQLEVKLGSVAAIKASRVSMNTPYAGFLGMQLAPDSKIYLSHNSTYLGVISRPNEKAPACNIDEDKISLTPGSGYLGMPSYINDFSYDPYNGISFTILDSCSGSVQFAGSTVMVGSLQWHWDFGDGQTSNQQNPLHVFNPSTNLYTVTLTITSTIGCGRTRKSRVIRPSGIVDDVDFEIVNRCDSGYVRFVNKTKFLQDSTGLITWDFGDGTTSNEWNPVHVYSGTGLYNVKLKLTTNISCLDDSATHTVNLDPFIIDALASGTILVGEKFQLSASGPAKKYEWTPGIWLNDSTITSPIAAPLHDITYTVTGTNIDGCIAKDSVFIKVIPLKDVYVPNGFTPGSDGKNDILRPWFPAGYTLTEFSIFNRWGKKIFSTRERGTGWNGKLGSVKQASDVYVWVFHARNESGKRIQRNGTFVLIQ